VRVICGGVIPPIDYDFLYEVQFPCEQYAKNQNGCV
jgi:hypothetical protein